MPTHLLLTTGDSGKQARIRVCHFFEKNFLVKYDRVVIAESRIISGAHPEFWPTIENGIAANRQAVTKFLVELRDSGFKSLDDLAGMKQGYESKLLHLATHLLDGFFGVDTVFYNLEEDAHAVSTRLAAAVKDNPVGFWLVKAECDIDTGHEADRLVMIRKFEVAPPET